MTFKLPSPEDLAKLTLAELGELRTQAVEARNAIAALPEDELDEAALDAFDQIVEGLATIDGRSAEVQAAETALADRRAAVRAATEEPADEADADADEADADTDPEDVVIPDDASELEEREPVIASARRGAAAKAARRAPKQEVDPVDDVDTTPKVAITAAANVPKFNSGAPLADFRELSEAFQSRSAGWRRNITRAEMEAKPRSVLHLSERHTRAGVARIDKAGGQSEFAVDSRMSTAEQFDVIMKAANEKQRFGKGGIIAAGSWCAPSETIYDGFLTLETVSGILSIAEVTADRGGINFTKGPDYASIAATFGFLQTEAEAELGTEK